MQLAYSSGLLCPFPGRDRGPRERSDADERESDTDSAFRLQPCAEPSSIVKVEDADGSGGENPSGESLDMATPSSLFDDIPVPAGEFGLNDVDLVSSPDGCLSLLPYEGYEDIATGVSGPDEYDILAPQPEDCVCAEVTTAENALVMFKGAAQDIVAFLSSLPGNLPIHRRCKIVRRVRSLTAGLRCV